MTMEKPSQSSRSSSRHKCLRHYVSLIALCLLFPLITFNMFYGRKGSVVRGPIKYDVCDVEFPAVAITISSLDSRFQSLGGMKHWFHLLERLIVNTGKFSDLQQNIADMKADRRLTIYVVFNEKSDAENLGSFGRMLFTSLITGKELYLAERIIFGYSTTRSAVRGGVQYPIEAHMLHTSYTVDLTSQEPEGMFTHNDQREFDSRLGYHSGNKDVSTIEPKAICLQILSRVSLDEVNKKLEWFDSSFDQFQLFRSMVYSTCDITRNQPTRKIVSVPDEDDYFSAFKTKEQKGKPKQRRMESQSLKGPTISGSNEYTSSKNTIIVEQNSNSNIKVDEHDKESDDYYKGLSVIADSVEINYLPSDSVKSDDLNVGTGEMQNKIKRSNWKNKIEDEDLRISPVAQACRKEPLKLLIYQRDTSRRIVNVEESAMDLRTRLGLNWTVEILSHSENMSPCDVINSVRTATVLVTPHGFQSVLLLFQPLNSVIVEVHPSYYFKQEVYGFIQAGFRQNFNVARSYLAEESVPVHWTMKFIINFFQLFGYMTHECMHSSLCRNVARRQDVLMSKSFISRTADFLSTHFILKCPN